MLDRLSRLRVLADDGDEDAKECLNREERRLCAEGIAQSTEVYERLLRSLNVGDGVGAFCYWCLLLQEQREVATVFDDRVADVFYRCSGYHASIHLTLMMDSYMSGDFRNFNYHYCLSSHCGVQFDQELSDLLILNQSKLFECALRDAIANDDLPKLEELLVTSKFLLKVLSSDMKSDLRRYMVLSSDRPTIITGWGDLLGYTKLAEQYLEQAIAGNDLSKVKGAISLIVARKIPVSPETVVEIRRFLVRDPIESILRFGFKGFASDLLDRIRGR